MEVVSHPGRWESSMPKRHAPEVRALTPLLLTLCGAALASAATLTVPGDYGAIQPALDAASAGDTILVAPGTYRGADNRNLSFGGKDLLLISSDGAEKTIIECDGAPHGIAFNRGETRAALIEGFTIRGADNRDIGGGLWLTSGSSPTLRACIVADNHSDFYGGGIYISSGRPLIEDCVVRGNSVRGHTGRGGGIHCSAAEAEIRGCLIEENYAYQSGGGLFCWAASPTVTGCIIRDNSSSIRGGGVYCKVDSAPLLENCIIRDNRSSYGGGAYCYVNSTPTFSNCTIVGNRATEIADGIFTHVTSSPTLLNCIMRDNEPEEFYVSGAEPVLRYTNIEGGWPGEGNSDQDPLFLRYHGFDLLPAPGSPAIDAGDPEMEDAIYDSDPRWPAGHVDGARADMGAYGGPNNGVWEEYWLR
jgi:parallel beta-helix repeat protein